MEDTTGSVETDWFVVSGRHDLRQPSMEIHSESE